MEHNTIINELKKYSSESRKKTNELFFKTNKGQYGYGEEFIGVSMPDLRKIASNIKIFNKQTLNKLIKSKIHEERMLALIVLVNTYNKSTNINKRIIYNFYIRNKRYINNWDLVDVSTPNIVGNYLYNIEKNSNILYKLVQSNSLWDRRISIVSTLYFIKKNILKDTLKISKILINDKEDLINKAVGWMLREAGKRNEGILEKFIKTNYSKINRTTLRYSIERFDKAKRKKYLKGNFN